MKGSRRAFPVNHVAARLADHAPFGMAVEAAEQAGTLVAQNTKHEVG